MVLPSRGLGVARKNAGIPKSFNRPEMWLDGRNKRYRRAQCPGRCLPAPLKVCSVRRSEGTILQGAMTTDRELLRRYAQDGAEEAFTEIVRRHVNLVYGAALRQLCGNDSLAQDVTQAVFTALAAKGDAHLRIKHVSAWLFATTRFTVSHTVRTERRRQDREQKAQSMHALTEESGPHPVPDMPPNLLDEVLESLDEMEREAVLLRFIEGKSFAAVGSALDTTEDAARMRVTRALEKARTLFARKGITSSAAALGAALANLVVAAPANLAAKVSAAALSGTAAIAASGSAKIGFTSIMTATKATTWLAAAAGIFAIGYSVYEHRAATVLGEEASRLTQERDGLLEALNRSKQRSVELARQAAQSDERASSLQKKLDGIVAARPMRVISVPAGGSNAKDAERMLQMKPLLEQGMPIKGAVIVLVDGKPVQQPVQFVMGKETRIDAADEGVYVVTPTLNEDGSVKYAMVLRKKDPDGGPDQVETLPFVTQIPWGGFTLAVGGGKVIAFDPD